MSAYRNNGPHYDSALWLRQWVGSDHARVAELASALEVYPETVNDWLTGVKPIQLWHARQMPGVMHKIAGGKS